MNLRTSQKHSRLERALVIMLVMVLCLAQVVPAYAVDTIGNGVEATYDEAYYATMDYYGNLLQGSVVKSYIMNGQSSITDYGQYDEVINLTDTTKAKTTAATAQFDFGKKVPGHFYFEGRTAAPFYALPWTTEIHYRLNGVMTEAEKLAGKQGMVDILLDFTPNENASEYARNNYVMAATAIFNQDDILSLEAEGAQVQLVGNLRLVLFMVMPGEEQHFKISVGSDSFEFGGMTFLMMPATLAQLKEISKLADNKEDIEKNYDLLNDSLNTLLDSLDNMSGSLYDAADGLDELNEGREIISKNKDGMYKDLDEALVSLDGLDTALQKMPGHMDAMEKVTDQTHAVLDDLDDTTKDIQKQLRKMKTDMNALGTSVSKASTYSNLTSTQTKRLAEQADKLKQDYDKLIPMLADLQIKLGTNEFTVNPEGVGALNMKALSSIMANSSQDDLNQIPKLQTLYAGFTSNGAVEMTKDKFVVAAQVASDPTHISTTAAAANYTSYLGNKTAVMSNVATLMGAGKTFEEAVFLTLKASIMAGGATEEQATALATEKAAGFVTLYKLEQVYDLFVGKQTPASTMNETEFVAAMVYASKAGTAAPVTDTEAFTMASVAGLGSMNNNLATCIGLLGSTGLGGNAAKLLGETGTALKHLSNVSKEAAEVIDQADDILDSLDDLHEIENNNYKDIKGLVTDSKDAVTSLSKTINSTHKALSTFEDTMKNAGKKLDSGSKKSLEAIAKTLRSAGNSLNKTTNVKNAKNNISSIIEDIWNDYTGDVNRLLLMDASAPAESLTDARNATPTSVQILMRSQEITIDDGDTPDITIPDNSTTFWGRIAQMFSDLWSWITGIFN